jgi:AcrR family transcriptional regulator
MQKQQGFKSGRGVLDLSLPLDIAARSQRQRIVAAMIETCARKTFAETTIADIVGAASISRTTFYKHFSDKRACFDVAVEACISDMQAAAEGTLAQTDPPAEAIRKGTVAILELLADNPSLAQVALGEVVAVDPVAAERYRELVISALESCWTSADEKAHGESDPLATPGRAQVLILEQLASGRAKQLPALLPEIVYVAILPFAGHDEALRQARLIAAGGTLEEARDASAG